MLAAARIPTLPAIHTFAGVLLALSALSILAQQGVPLPGGLRLKMSDDLLPYAPTRVSPQTLAAPAEAAAPASGGGSGFGPGVRLRGVTLNLRSEIRMDDNILRTRYDEQFDSVLVLQPGIILDGSVGRHPFRFGYSTDLERYLGFESQNSTGHDFFSEWRWNATRRFRMLFDAGLEFGTDGRGELQSRTVGSLEPDRWRQHGFGVEAILGRRIAKAEVGVSYDLRGIRYFNNDQGIRDLDARTLRLFGRYNVSPRFALVSETGGEWTNYLSPQSTLNNKKFWALGGIAWQATAKTTGEIMVGQSHTHFYDPGSGSTNGATWRAEVTWAPRTYSKFTAYTTRENIDDAFGADESTTSANVDTYGLRWRYGLSERLDFNTGFEKTDADFVDGQSDRYFSMFAGVRYKANRFFDVFARWEYSSRSSFAHLSDYEDHAVFVGFDARFDHPFNR